MRSTSRRVSMFASGASLVGAPACESDAPPACESGYELESVNTMADWRVVSAEDDPWPDHRPDTFADEVPVDFSAPAGTPVYFHLHNHGYNTWNSFGLDTQVCPDE